MQQFRVHRGQHFAFLFFARVDRYSGNLRHRMKPVFPFLGLSVVRIKSGVDAGGADGGVRPGRDGIEGGGEALKPYVLKFWDIFFLIML
jgi:hypothetical protein